MMSKECGYGLLRAKFGKYLPPRDDMKYCDEKYQAEFDKGIKIGKNCPPDINTRATKVIKRYWDTFYYMGACRPIRGFEFMINTGDSPPVCCHFPIYGPHKSKIIKKQRGVINGNGWRWGCGGHGDQLLSSCQSLIRRTMLIKMVLYGAFTSRIDA
jgi:hypothetical protein